MRRLRLGFLLIAAGFAAKGATVVAYHFSHLPVLVKVLTTCGPLGVRMADALLPPFFDLGGIAPPVGAPAVYVLEQIERN